MIKRGFMKIGRMYQIPYNSIDPKVGYIFTEKFVSKDVVTVSLIKNGNIDKMHNISRTIWNITIKECKQIIL